MVTTGDVEGIAVFDHVNQLFEWLPVAAVVSCRVDQPINMDQERLGEKVIVCVHGTHALSAAGNRNQPAPVHATFAGCGTSVDFQDHKSLAVACRMMNVCMMRA